MRVVGVQCNKEGRQTAKKRGREGGREGRGRVSGWEGEKEGWERVGG